MSVPVPIDLVMGAIPLGFKGGLQDFANVIVDNITATMDGTFLTGQVGGNAPTSNVGPWLNGNEWWFWDSSSGQYVPDQQGTPIGTIAMWGSDGAPPHWLKCDGSSVSATTYPFLYQAIGTRWGSQGTGLFNLPPGFSSQKCFFLNNASGGPLNTLTPIDPNSPVSDGVSAFGGGETTTIDWPQLPQLFSPVYATPLNVGIQGGTPDLYAAATSGATLIGYVAVVGPQAADYPPLGQKAPFTIMPPFVEVNYIIKFQ